MKRLLREIWQADLEGIDFDGKATGLQMVAIYNRLC